MIDKQNPSNRSKILYKRFLISHIFGHLNGNGYTFLIFPEDSPEPFSLLSTVRKRQYFENSSIAIEDIEDGKVKVWFFIPSSFRRVHKIITNEVQK